MLLDKSGPQRRKPLAHGLGEAPYTVGIDDLAGRIQNGYSREALSRFTSISFVGASSSTARARISAPLAQYSMADQDAEVSLARRAAPESRSNDARRDTQ
jgi:hypothetical protein